MLALEAVVHDQMNNCFHASDGVRDGKGVEQVAEKTTLLGQKDLRTSYHTPAL
jgi:hypothetical protein